MVKFAEEGILAAASPGSSCLPSIVADIAQSVVGLEKTLQDEFYEAEKQLASIEKQFSASGGFGAWLQNIFRF